MVEAPYEEYESGTDDGEGAAAKAADLEALTLRIETQVEHRIKQKVQDDVASSLLALQRDIAHMAISAAAKEKEAYEKIFFLQSELEKHRWLSC
ncbi:MAG: hypothetical protein SGPRY_001336 [Prymnesium sp.]